MSTFNIIRIFCDGGNRWTSRKDRGCVDWEERTTSTPEVAREKLVRLGWVSFVSDGGVVDLCPQCAVAMQEANERSKGEGA